MPGTVLGRTWYRPTMVIFTNAAPTASVASVGVWDIGSTAGTDYLFLTDDNRSELSVSTERIEYRKRMVNGRMRSYHVADKRSFSLNWTDLPSSASFISENQNSPTLAWGAGKQILDWYENHSDSFYVMFVYDSNNFVTETVGNSTKVPTRFKVETYNVFFDDLTYNVKTRNQYYDRWDLSLALVEV